MAKPDLLYDINDSGISGDVGKVQYVGESSNGQLTDGRIYDCIGVAYCQIRLIDDSGKPYYYNATRPSCKFRDAKFVVIEDNSPRKILTAFVSGEKTRTPKEEDIEQKYITWFISASREQPTRQRIKPHCTRTEFHRIGYVERTPERNAHEKKVLSDFARSIAPLVLERYQKHVEEVYETVRQRDNHRCVLCGKEAKEGEKLYPRLIISQEKGGKVDAENLRTLCKECGLKEVEAENAAKKKR